MACSFKINAFTCCSNDNNFKTCPVNFTDSKLMRKSLGLSTDQRGFRNDNVQAPIKFSVRVCNQSHHFALCFLLYIVLHGVI